MSLQVLTLTLDGITADDYLTWCRDPDPPALDLTLRSISADADPLGDRITAILDWNQPPPSPVAAAAAAGLPLPSGVKLTSVTCQSAANRDQTVPRPGAEHVARSMIAASVRRRMPGRFGRDRSRRRR